MEKIFIIAEAGVNHNGNILLAKKMIDIAANAGADAVKFQTFITEYNISKYAPKAEYQLKTTNSSESQFEMIKKLELDVGAHRELNLYCQNKNILFLSTPFDYDSVDLLNSLRMEIFKIASSEITNLPLLRYIGRLKKRIILSTGMADLEEIEDALGILEEEGTNLENVTILHCNSEYPTPVEDVNLKAMATIKETFNTKIGYSDHTVGIEIPIAAAAMGATVIEKHFTLDKNMEGPDQKASLEPNELKKMVKAIRNIEVALGDGIKKPNKTEEKNKPVMRKSIVAKKDILKGELFTERNLAVKRPGSGINPMLWDEIIGNEAKKDYKMDELI